MKPKALSLRFYRTKNRREPVRGWLKELDKPDSMVVSEDIAAIQYGWPIGMPVCRAFDDGLYEVRSSLAGGRIARVLFFFADGEIILTHGFIGKRQKTPKGDLRLARDRRRDYST